MTIKTKTLERIEEQIEQFKDTPLRQSVLIKAKSFKTSWIELGQALHQVWQDKLFKEWGFSTFEIYVAKETGLRKETSMKLLRSYYFLEKEEPHYLTKEYRDSSSPRTVPSYEAVNLLRLAKNRKDIDVQDYRELKEDILEKGKDYRDVKKGLTAVIKQRKEEMNPEEARSKKRDAVIRRFLGTLKATKSEIELLNLLPKNTINQMAALIQKIEEQL